jgi:plasmid stabilization system protein ParE
MMFGKAEPTAPRSLWRKWTSDGRAKLPRSFHQSAWVELEDIVDYWTERGEPERGEEYAHDLPAEAIQQLSDPGTARTGRHLRHTLFPEVQELPVFKRSYRILYLVKAHRCFEWVTG